MRYPSLFVVVLVAVGALSTGCRDVYYPTEPEPPSRSSAGIDEAEAEAAVKLDTRATGSRKHVVVRSPSSEIDEPAELEEARELGGGIPPQVVPRDSRRSGGELDIVYEKSTPVSFRTDLIAGGGGGTGTIVGEVSAWNSADYLYVRYEITDPDWVLVRTYVHAADALDDIPQKNGNPKPGQFSWKENHGSTGEYIQVIPLGSHGSDYLYVAAKGLVNRQSTGDSAGVWAYGHDFPGKNWAMYFVYELDLSELRGN